MDLIMTNYSFKSMTEQANAIQENLISPVKLLEEFFEKIYIIVVNGFIYDRNYVVFPSKIISK